MASRKSSKPGISSDVFKQAASDAVDVSGIVGAGIGDERLSRQ